MPRSTREWAKRKLKEACNNIDWAGTHIDSVQQEYESAHKEISGPLLDIQNLLVIVQAAINKVESSF